MTRERWMLAGVGALAFVLVATGVTLIVLGGGDDEVSTAATTTTSTTTTVPVSTSAGGSPSVTVGIICTTPEEAAMSMVEAWLAGDQAAASRCATPEAVTTLFQTSAAGAQYSWQGCGGDPGMPTCVYTYEGGALQLMPTGTEATGWTVQSVDGVAD